MVHDLTLQFLIDEVWTNVAQGEWATSANLSISYGQPDEQGESTPAACSFRLNDPTGRYVPDNPRSDLFGKIGRNTAVRVQLGSSTEEGTFISTNGTEYTIPMSTPFDHAYRDGPNTSIEVFVEPEEWSWDAALYGGQTRRTLIAIADDNTGNGSTNTWRLDLLNTGQLEFRRWTGGTVSSTLTPVVAFTGRKSIQVVYDGTTGGGIYHGDALGGPYTLITTITGTGTPQAGNGYNLTIGATTAGTNAWHGKLYGALLFDNGVTAGGWAANFESKAVVRSFEGLNGETWTLGGSAVHHEDASIFTGYLAEIYAESNKAETHAWTNMVCSGIARIVDRAALPEVDPLRSAILAQAGLWNYWPMQDPGPHEFGAHGQVAAVSGSTSFNRIHIVGDGVDPRAYDDFVATDFLPEFGEDVYVAYSGSPSTNLIRVSFALRLPDAGLANNTFLMYWFDTPSTQRAYSVRAMADGDLKFTVHNLSSGAESATESVSWLLNGRRAYVTLTLYGDGANVNIDADAFLEDRTQLTMTGTSLGGYGGNVALTSLYLNVVPAVDLDGTVMGHLNVVREFGSATPSTAVNTREVLIPSFAFAAFFSEPAAQRIARNASQVNLPVYIDEPPELTHGMDYQQAGTLGERLKAAANADMGLLGDDPQTGGWGYRSFRSLIGQTPHLELDYSQGYFNDPFVPTFDDQQSRNVVSVTRPGGAGGYARLDEGPMSTQNPPNGITVYEASYEVQVDSSAAANDAANWLLSTGTEPGARLREITLTLGNPRVDALLPDLKTLRIGDLVKITNLPAHLSPEPLFMMVRFLSWNFALGTTYGSITLTLLPAEVWRSGIIGPDTVNDNAEDAPTRLASEESFLTDAVDSDDTTLFVGTDGVTWTESADDVPMLLRIGGPEQGAQETVRCTAIAKQLTDDFNRANNPTSWGTAPTGQAWAHRTSGGVTWNITSNRARTVIGTAGNFGWSDITPGSAGLQDYTMFFRTSVLPVGGAIAAGVFINQTGDVGLALGQFYIAYLSIGAGASFLNLNLQDDGGLLQTIALNFSWAINTNFGVRLQAQNGVVRARAFVQGFEPEAWHVSNPLTDVPGGGACGAFVSSEATVSNVPFTVESEDSVLHSPQQFTVVRSINGWADSHDAGAPVDVRYPLRLAY